MLTIITSLFVLTVGATSPEDLKRDLDRWRPLRLGGTAPTISMRQIKRAFSGEIVAGIEVVEKIKAGKGYALGVFDVPIERVWRGVCDEETLGSYHRQLPGSRREDLHGGRERGTRKLIAVVQGRQCAPRPFPRGDQDEQEPCSPVLPGHSGGRALRTMDV